MHVKGVSRGDVTFDKYCCMEVDLTTKEAGSCSKFMLLAMYLYCFS